MSAPERDDPSRRADPKTATPAEESAFELPADARLVDELKEFDPPHDLGGELLLREDPATLGRRRHTVTLLLLTLVAGGSIGIFLGAFFASPDRWPMIERASEIVLVPLFTLLAAAVGWYFSEKSHR